MRNINLSIMQKLMAMVGAIMLITGSSLLYLALEIRQGDEVINSVIDEQAKILTRLQTVHAGAKKFDEMRFWLSDLAVSWLNESEEEAEAAYKELQALFLSMEATDQSLVARLRPQVDAYKEEMYSAVDAYVDENRLLGNSHVVSARESARIVNEQFLEISAEVNELATATTSRLVQNNSSLLITAFFALAAAIFIGSLLTWLFARTITRPINYAVGVADRISDGDLSMDINITSEDEMGKLLLSLKTMQAKFTEVIGEIKSTSTTLQSRSSDISQGNADLSKRTEEQAASLEETASSMEEMTSSVEQNAGSARQASELAINAHNTAEQGGDAVNKVVVAMGDISESSKKISNIIGVINEIAFQTNLLALNAAVEAARAGEQGRGFAVVASEVRNLAQRSASAAMEIKQLIDDSVSKVDEGTRLVNESGATLEEIVNQVKKVNDIIAEIAEASEEQSSGISQVNKSITLMDSMTQKNATLVGEATSASREVRGQAQRLVDLVTFFSVDEGDGAERWLSEGTVDEEFVDEEYVTAEKKFAFGR